MKDLMKPYSKTPALATLRYPVIATPKLDGIRCAVENGKLRTFNKKPVPNKFINDTLKPFMYLLEGLDGELMIRGADFNGVQSGVMAQHGNPDFYFVVFDAHDCNFPYKDRIEYVAEIIDNFKKLGYKELERIELIKYELCTNSIELQAAWDSHVAAGYEGTIAAEPRGYYKNGRSGLKEQLLVKLKHWHDDEAVIVEVREELDANGVPKGRAGVLWAKHRSGTQFGVAGLTDELKALYWKQRDTLPGKTVTFKYQDWPLFGAPRFPGFKGIRYA